MTANVPKQIPNTSKVKKNAYLIWQYRTYKCLGVSPFFKQQNNGGEEEEEEEKKRKKKKKSTQLNGEKWNIGNLSDFRCGVLARMSSLHFIFHRLTVLLKPAS